MPDFQFDFEIHKPEREGEAWHAVRPDMAITVLPDCEDARIVHRRLYQPFAKPQPIQRAALVAHLNGVRLYIRGSNLVMTTQKLQP